uniref:Calponin-homology (CH) domain-containing protein n=1 Tax=Mola mola TaxID=94237 RepID=A0A3Q4BDX0_MOLML
MSDILCRWLNEELRLSQVVEPKTLAKNFSSGYLIGEVLYKYQLQNDFSMFTKKDTSISKLNNFTRLEPTLYLLGISLDINMAQALMQEKQGVAARLLYQLYTSLEKQKKARIGGTMMEMIQPAASAGLHKKEYEIYSDVCIGQDYDTAASGAKLILQSSSKYIQDIQQRLGENAAAREQRERRLNRFMMEQLKAHEAQEEAQREEQLVRRLTRQTQQEQRLVAQLLQIRRQKEVIRENCLFREQQYQQRRERDFQESLEREAKLERPEEIRRELEFCDRIAAERAQIRYMKHFAICEDILEQMVDLATKVGEYQLVNDNQIPEKQMREWKELLLHGLPLYEPSKSQQPGSELSEPLDPIELKKQEILNNRDYDEYTNMVGEWAWPEEAGETKSPPAINSILRHIVIRLRNLAHQPVVCPNSPSFPRFTLKACVLGKFCSGKSTCLAKIAEAHGIHVLSADTLIEEALNAHQKGKKVGHPSLFNRVTKVISDLRQQNICFVPTRQIPPRSRWILDGFPLDITQAHMLEKALGGPVRNTVKSNSTDLTADPNPPKPPPPPAPALDLAVLLDIPNERVAQRSLSHTGTPCIGLCCLLSTIVPLSSRISSFQETWPKLEEWFDEKQNILVRVDADVDEEELYKRLEWVLQAMMHPQKGEWFLYFLSVSVFCYIPRNPPSPGSSSWVYVDEPLPSKLCSHWDTMCESYVNNIKAVMQQLRSQHAMINHHLYSTREEYKNYLRRPDQKQQLVSQWQKDFNSIFDDMREDGETKELCEHLRDISDQRKEEDEKERDALLGEGWLEDHTAILINHHSILLQMEMDRFQATLCILKVYYLSMYSQMFSELPSNAVRISLLDTQKMKDQYKGLLRGLLLIIHDTIDVCVHLTSIDQLSQVCRHHIEAAVNLQNEVVLVCNDFIIVLIHHTTLQEDFPFLSHPQLMEIVSLLMDEFELIDWRWFLLSAAFPWPTPSLMQLLAVLQRFRATDMAHTGYVNEEQYLQVGTDLWFSRENVQPVPEDPSEPLPYDRLANLRRFFFKLFADHSFSPPRLDYVSMLQYFAADPNPRQGFIRALSVVLGQHLRDSSPSDLVKVSNSTHKEKELGYRPEDCVPFSVLSQHPFIQGLMENSRYQLVVSNWTIDCI